MKIPLRKILLIIWFVSLVTAGVLISKATGNNNYGYAAGLSLLSISLGVPLMRAFTEFSK